MVYLFSRRIKSVTVWLDEVLGSGSICVGRRFL
jgi:hypothetical protein